MGDNIDHQHSSLTMPEPNSRDIGKPEAESLSTRDDAFTKQMEISDQANTSTVGQSSGLKLRLATAIGYAFCSVIITLINKIVLTTYKFPSVNLLAVCQLCCTISMLKTAHFAKLVEIRATSLTNKKLYVLAFIYIASLITSLGGTKSLSIPMYTVLRRFTIPFTAILEFYLLGIRQTTATILTISAMIGGALIAASSDLSFNAYGYFLVLSSDLFFASNVVYTKKTIDTDELNKQEILYYNAFLTVLPQILITYLTYDRDELSNYEYWDNSGFMLSFLTSCVMGYFLMYSTILCTQYNSALTTSIVGALKSILTLYIGMFIGGDYHFKLLNFIGLNIALLGGLVYSYLKFAHRNDPKKIESNHIDRTAIKTVEP